MQFSRDSEDEIFKLIKSGRWDHAFDALNDPKTVDENSERLLERLAHIIVGELQSSLDEAEPVMSILKLAFAAGRSSVK
jgi:hypothetical protein